MLRALRRFFAPSDLQCRYPDEPEALESGLRGVPTLRFEKCGGCSRCVAACPTTALSLAQAPVGQVLTLSLANCLQCGRCQETCPEVITETRSYELATLRKSALAQVALISGAEPVAPRPGQDALLAPHVPPQEDARALFSRGLRVYLVDAGDCGGCAQELNAAFSAPYDLARLGVERVSSPSQADAIIVTGPVTRGLFDEIREAYDSAASPKLVIALGACAVDGGVFRGSYGSLGGVDRVLPVDVYVPGCAPTPRSVLHAIRVAMKKDEPSVKRREHTAPGFPANALETALEALGQRKTAPPPPPRATYQPPEPEEDETRPSPRPVAEEARAAALPEAPAASETPVLAPEPVSVAPSDSADGGDLPPSHAMDSAEIAPREPSDSAEDLRPPIPAQTLVLGAAPASAPSGEAPRAQPAPLFPPASEAAPAPANPREVSQPGFSLPKLSGLGSSEAAATPPSDTLRED